MATSSPSQRPRGIASIAHLFLSQPAATQNNDLPQRLPPDTAPIALPLPDTGQTGICPDRKPTPLEINPTNELADPNQPREFLVFSDHLSDVPAVLRRYADQQDSCGVCVVDFNDYSAVHVLAQPGDGIALCLSPDQFLDAARLLPRPAKAVVLTTCRPEDIVASYQTLKFLAQNDFAGEFALFVAAPDQPQALQVFAKIRHAVNRFLARDLAWDGCDLPVL